MANLYAGLVCPPGASYRLDRWSGEPMSSTGKWDEISFHRDPWGNPVWGQSQCYGTGTECHLYDWFTWWFPSLISEPDTPPDPEGEGEFSSEYVNSPPVGYNSATGEYLY